MSVAFNNLKAEFNELLENRLSQSDMDIDNSEDPSKVDYLSSNRLERAIKTLSKRHDRTVEHYLTGQIEAEYAFDHPESSLLVCGALYDEDMVPLLFESVIGDVLDMFSIVNVENIHEDPEIFNSRNSKPLKMEDSKESNVVSVSILSTEDKFQAVLHNKIHLDLFKDFCIKEKCIEYLLFWIEVETLQSVNPVQRQLLIKYIYNTFIKDDSPLKVNLGNEIRKDIRFNESNCSVSVFDDAQEHVYALMKKRLFSKFENTDKYRQLKNSKNELSADDFDDFASAYSPKYDKLLIILPNIKTELTEEKQDTALSNAISRYFTVDSSLLQGYFSAARFLSKTQRLRKQLKEKRLNKFFGQKISENVMLSQLDNINVEDVESSNEKEFTLSNASDEISSKMLKLKKVDKLNTFFGDQLQKTALKSQNLYENYVSSIQSTSDENIEEIKTTNTITAEQKMVLTKRNKKLLGYFGENLDERVVQQSLVAPIKKLIPAIVEPEYLEINRTKDIMLSMERSNNRFDTTTGEFRSRTSSTDSSFTTNIYNDPKKKIEKLQEFLGERINLRLLEKEQRKGKFREPLNPEEKKVHMKRSNKLEKVFGIIPPSDMLILTGSNIDPVQKSLLSLKYLVDNDDEIVELLSFIGSEAMPTFALDIEETKNSRQKRLAKLQKFFGTNGISPLDLIEQNVLRYLEQSIEIRYSGDELLQLKEDLNKVREKVQKQSIDYGGEEMNETSPNEN
ncbi:Regulator of G protein signaling domain-containing protein [Rozella allomycis CSF55]|uniref:Regulator of G protein signaling domain-containing protein n=2 Tax=Rozella allomycis (strain CSF55) TaxID=988480 RepID=A0A075B4V5_ROZAC|nr:Regulator of G protein signaling domain-containing protein [Rozella allomycis CSF55]|eukprot:EPZ36666.1 Regulator of G protein signaling domain-containing protein [Rozella allomycis CSF55]